MSDDFPVPGRPATRSTSSRVAEPAARRAGRVAGAGVRPVLVGRARRRRPGARRRRRLGGDRRSPEAARSRPRRYPTRPWATSASTSTRRRARRSRRIDDAEQVPGVRGRRRPRHPGRPARESSTTAIQDDADCAHLDYDADIAALAGGPGRGGRGGPGRGHPRRRSSSSRSRTTRPPRTAWPRSELRHQRGRRRRLGRHRHRDRVGGQRRLAAGSDRPAGGRDDRGRGGAGTLADDATYQKWIEEVGDPGIVTMYLAPAAGPAMLELLDEAGAGAGWTVPSRRRSGRPRRDAPPGAGGLPRAWPPRCASTTGRWRSRSPGTRATGRAGYGPGRGGDAGGRACPRTPRPPSASASPTAGSPSSSTSLAASGDGPGRRRAARRAVRSSRARPPRRRRDPARRGRGRARCRRPTSTRTRSRARPTAPSVPVGLTVQGDPEAIEEVLDKLRVQLPPDGGDPAGSDAERRQDRDRRRTPTYRELLLARTAPSASRGTSATSWARRTGPAWCSTSTSTPATTGWSRAGPGRPGARRQPRAAQRARHDAPGSTGTSSHARAPAHDRLTARSARYRIRWRVDRRR